MVDTGPGKFKHSHSYEFAGEYIPGDQAAEYFIILNTLCQITQYAAHLSKPSPSVSRGKVAWTSPIQASVPVPRLGIAFDQLEMPWGPSSPDTVPARLIDLLLWACRAESFINAIYR